jgi:uncharacterized membrane protein
VTYLIVKFAHVLGAVVLLGTGAGIAFFMLLAHRSGDVRLIAGTAGIVVIADALFTASAIVAQPLTGFWLARASGASLADPLALGGAGALPRRRCVLAPRRLDSDPAARPGARGRARGGAFA